MPGPGRQWLNHVVMKKIFVLALPLLFSLCACAQHSIRYYNKGVRRAVNGNYEKAKAFFSRAIRLDPTLTEAWFNRALAKSKLKDYNGAVNDYSKAIELRPGFARAYNNRGTDKNELG